MYSQTDNYMFRLLRAIIRLTNGHIEQTVKHFVQFIKCVMELALRKTSWFISVIYLRSIYSGNSVWTPVIWIKIITRFVLMLQQLQILQIIQKDFLFVM
jgi:hypothetical protein